MGVVAQATRGRSPLTAGGREGKGGVVGEP